MEEWQVKEKDIVSFAPKSTVLPETEEVGHKLGQTEKTWDAECSFPNLATISPVKTGSLGWLLSLMLIMSSLGHGKEKQHTPPRWFPPFLLGTHVFHPENIHQGATILLETWNMLHPSYSIKKCESRWVMQFKPASVLVTLVSRITGISPVCGIFVSKMPQNSRECAVVLDF